MCKSVVRKEQTDVTLIIQVITRDKYLRRFLLIAAVFSAADLEENSSANLGNSFCKHLEKLLRKRSFSSANSNKQLDFEIRKNDTDRRRVKIIRFEHAKLD